MTDQLSSFRQSCLSWCTKYVPQMGSNSSMKSNLSLEKKIRLLTSENFDSVLEDVQKVRSTKFVEEMARAFVANPLKDYFDSISLAKMAYVFSCSHPDFSPHLTLSIRNQLDEAFHNAPLQWKKLLVLYFELFFFNVHSDVSNMGKYINLFSQESGGKIEMLDSFSELTRMYFKLFSDLEPGTKSEPIISAFKLVYRSYCSKLTLMNKNLLKSLDKERKYYENRGDLHEDRVQTINSLLKTVTDLELQLKSISSVINEPVPEVKMYQDVELTSSAITFVELNFEGVLSPYDNDEEQNFYEALPTIAPVVEESSELSEGDLMLQAAAVPELDPDTFKPGEQKLFNALCCAHSVEDVDSLATNLVRENVHNIPDTFILSEIFRCLKSRPESVKLLSRFAAILALHLPNFGKKLVLNVLGQISFLSKRLELILSARARLANFVGELCKFEALSDGVVFTCLRKTLDNPHLANMLMVCTIIDVCGRFLLNRKTSHKRMLNLIEVISRLKNTMPYPLYAVSIIESTITSVQSCDTGHISSATAAPTFPTVSFTKSLLRSPEFDPDDKTIQEVFRSLDWENESEILKVRAAFLKTWKMPFSSIKPVALFVCNLLSSHPSFVHSLLNDYCEIILTEVEKEHPNTQKLVSTFHILCVICQVAPLVKELMPLLMEIVMKIFELPNINTFQRGAIASSIYFCLRHFEGFLEGSSTNNFLRERLTDLISNVYTHQNYYDTFHFTNAENKATSPTTEHVTQTSSTFGPNHQDSGFDDDIARVIHKAVEERKLEKKQTLTDISNDLQRLKLVDTRSTTDDVTRFIFRRRNKIHSKQIGSKFSTKEQTGCS